MTEDDLKAIEARAKAAKAIGAFYDCRRDCKHDIPKLIDYCRLLEAKIEAHLDGVSHLSVSYDRKANND